MNTSAGESSFLDRLQTASPCSVPWDEMTGTDRVRDCSRCSRPVFNLSDMTSAEAEAFLKANGDSQCLAYYRRKDGTVITDDCPVALRRLRNTLKGLRRAAGFLISTLLSVGAASAQKTEPPFKSLKEKVGHELPARTLGRVMLKDTYKYTVPDFMSLKSGKHALGDELSMRDGRMFIDVSGPANTSSSPELTSPQEIPCNLSPREAYSKGANYEIEKMPKAAEAYYKLALKIFQANIQKVPSLQKAIALSYRDLLLKDGRTQEARSLEKEFNIPSQ